MNNEWLGGAALAAVLIVLVLVILASVVAGCSPRVIVQKEVVTEYRDRVIHDTAQVVVPLEVEKIVTRDTASHLENRWAESDAVVSGGFLSHSLSSRPQVIQVPVEVHTTDTLYKEAQIVEKEVEVEKPLSWWRKFKIGAFWYLCGAVLLLLVWTFRKFIF